MTRTSSDIFDQAGALVSGFDYDLQVWVKNYIVHNCGHRPEHACNCAGRKYAGQDIREVRRSFFQAGKI